MEEVPVVMKLVQIACPVFNEAAGIETFLERVDSEIGSIRRSQTPMSEIEFDMLIVNDGSSDATRELIGKFRPSHIRKIEVMDLSRNFGHTAAVSALVDHASGDALILMDADLQDEPALIGKLAQEWLAGNKSVRVQRAKRNEGAIFGILSKTFYEIFGALTQLKSHLGIFGLYDRRVYEGLRSFPEIVRYHPGLLSLVGFQTKLITADRNKRHSGRSRVGLLRLIKLANYAIFSFSTLPVLFVTTAGILISLTSFAAGLVVIWIRLFTDKAISGWASLLTVQFFLAGLMILSLGVVGQYIAIIVEEVKRRPKYLLDRKEATF